MHVLQKGLSSGTQTTQELYTRLRAKTGEGIGCFDPAPMAGLSVDLGKGDELSLDTFFGSFYHAYWTTYTDVRDVAVCVEFEGDIWVQVFEDSGSGVRIIARERLRAAERTTQAIPLPGLDRSDSPFGPAEKSRAYIVVKAQGASRIHALDYVTSTEPARQVRLSIGLCTFNQEKYFARTLARVLRLIEADDRVVRAYVVNQGNPFESAEILRLIEHPKVTLIEQRNLGGCGGFTRSLDEALKADETTHHLMMDDDIVLDERMIARALRFLDHASTDIALGAGMLDALRPTIMYEAGAFLRDDNKIEAYCHNVNLADPGQLYHFNKPVDTDYNAWWFCIIPMDRARTLDLPAPVFIRGDDFEYGQRLARAGVPTVTLPGIAVWHEPFYAKPTGWQGYYDLRNRLIFGATYADKVRQLSLAHVTGLITTAILTHDYMMAELRMKAVEDFLSGPKALFARDTEALHGEVMALAKAHAPEKLEGKSWKARPLAEGRPLPTRMRWLILVQALSMLKTGLGRHKTHTRPVFMDSDAHPRNTAGRAYVLTNGLRSFHLAFTPDRGRMWALLRRAAALALRYRRSREAISRDWAAHIEEYRTAGWWADVYAPGQAADSPAPDATATGAAQPEMLRA